MQVYRIHPAPKRNHKNKIQYSIHECIRPFLIFAQCCGQLPINGIGGKTVDSIVFTFKSLKIMYFLLVCCGIAFLTALQLYDVLKFGADLNLISDLMFYGCMLSLNFCYLHVAMKWKSLMKEWADMEMFFAEYGQLPELNFRIKLINISFGCIALVQHVMKAISDMSVTVQCKTGNESILEFYFKNVLFKQIFAIISYSTTVAFLLRLLHLLAFFFWLLTDAFIITMSTALAMRYGQINKKIKFTSQNKLHISVWREIRAHYNKLCRLCKLLDDVISPVILVSFAYNLFAILIQLFNSLRSMHNNIEKAYLFFSFGTVILRVIAVTLYGAWINDESKRPIVILNSVSSEVYNLEIRRFILQISFDSVALTGRGFFRITRSLIFSIAGAIVTYELVLIQFNENLLREEHTNYTSGGC